MPVGGSIMVELNRGHSLGGRQDGDILLASATPSPGITGRHKALPGNSGMVGPLRISPTSPVTLISFVSDLDSSLAVGGGPASEGATDDLPVAKACQDLGALNNLMSLQPDTDAVSSLHGARVMKPGSPPTLLGKAAHHPMAGRCPWVLRAGGGQYLCACYCHSQCHQHWGTFLIIKEKSINPSTAVWVGLRKRLQCHPPGTQWGWGWGHEAEPLPTFLCRKGHRAARKKTSLTGVRGSFCPAPELG